MPRTSTCDVACASRQLVSWLPAAPLSLRPPLPPRFRQQPKLQLRQCFGFHPLGQALSGSGTHAKCEGHHRQSEPCGSQSRSKGPTGQTGSTAEAAASEPRLSREGAALDHLSRPRGPQDEGVPTCLCRTRRSTRWQPPAGHLPSAQMTPAPREERNHFARQTAGVHAHPATLPHKASAPQQLHLGPTLPAAEGTPGQGYVALRQRTQRTLHLCDHSLLSTLAGGVWSPPATSEELWQERPRTASNQLRRCGQPHVECTVAGAWPLHGSWPAMQAAPALPLRFPGSGGSRHPWPSATRHTLHTAALQRLGHAEAAGEWPDQRQRV